MRISEKKILEEMTSEVVQSVKQLSMLHGDIFNMLCKGTRDFMGVLLNYAEDNILGEEELKAKYCKVNDLLQAALGAGVISDELINAVDEVSKQVNEIIPKKLEVVFFCYKASMSDCFESIFTAAQADPECDAYFVPIPYYDLDGNLQPIEMHLEAEGYYPEGFPLIDYRTYDVVKRRPDVIYIMNPYDDHNRSTRVHEDYYSSRLRNYTKHLTYIEYGLPVWPPKDGNDPRLEPGFLPGHIYCRHFVSVTEGITDMYRNILSPGTSLTENTRIPDDAPDDRFLTLGSPKIDKVVNTHKEDYTIPEEWKVIIGDKKIILYASSLTSLLMSSKDEKMEIKGEQYFTKLEEILNEFKNRSDVILWWRPHPLFETTIRSMRPMLFERYNSYIRELKNSGRGIFDTSIELARAINYCDGIICDEGSILWLAAAKGIPFFMPSVQKYRQDPPIFDDGEDFKAPLENWVTRMRNDKGANSIKCNVCVWWNCFLEEDTVINKKYNRFTKRFIDFIVNEDKYPEVEEYKELLRHLFYDFVVNPDGTAGQKIYECLKEKALGDRNGQNT